MTSKIGIAAVVAVFTIAVLWMAFGRTIQTKIFYGCLQGDGNEYSCAADAGYDPIAH